MAVAASTEPGSPGARRRARYVLGTSGVAHFVHDGCSDAIYVLLPIWTGVFGLSLTQVGLLKGLYVACLAGFQMPAALLAERWGERLVLGLGTVLAGLSYIAFGWAGDFWSLAALLVMAGLASGIQHPLSSAVVAQTYAGGGRRAALGIYNFTGDLGKVAAPLLIGTLAGLLGWRSGSLIWGILAVLGGVAVFLAFQRLGVGAVLHQAPSQEGKPPTIRGWGITNRRGFTALSAVAVVDGTIRTGFMTFVPFLLLDKGVGIEGIGFALALILGGGAAGKLACGLIAERLGIIRTVVITELMTSAGILLLLVLPLVPSYLLLPFVGLALNGTSSVLYGTVAEFVDPARQSRAFGLFYTLGIGSSAMAPAAYGWISDVASLELSLALVGLSALLTLPLCLPLARCLGPEPACNAGI